MWTRHAQEPQHRSPDHSGRSAAVFLTYFGFHAYHGEFGIYSKYQLEARAVDTAISS